MSAFTKLEDISEDLFELFHYLDHSMSIPKNLTILGAMASHFNIFVEHVMNGTYHPTDPFILSIISNCGLRIEGLNHLVFLCFLLLWRVSVTIFQELKFID